MKTLRAISISLFCLIFLSVALAQSEVSNNFEITSSDHNIFNKGWVYVDVTNLNTLYGRAFDISIFLHNNSATVLAIEERKNIPHILTNYSTTCNPYNETTDDGITITHANCTTVNNPYISWFLDWKPAKQFLINGMKNRQKSTDIFIGKGETKRFRFFVEIPIGSKVKFDVGVHSGGADTILDPWIYSNWHLRRCYTAFENSGTALTNHQINITVDTATLISADKLRSDCNDSRWGNETGGFDFYLEKGCNTAKTVYWAEVPYIPANGNATVCHYYNNSAATTSLSNSTATFKFFDDFTGTAVDTSKWIVTANCAGHYGVSGGTFNFNGSGTGSWDCSVFTQNNFSRPFIYELDAWTNNTASAWGMGIHDNTSGAGLAEFIYWLFWEGASDRFAIYEEVTKRLDTVFDYPTSAWVLSRFWVMNTGANYTVNKTTTTNETWLYNSSYSSEDNVKVGFNYQTGTTPKVDNVRVRAYAYPEPNYTTGNEESSEETIIITIHNPTASVTYLNNTVLLNFTVTSDLRTTINTTIQLNGTTYLRPNVTNNSAYTMTVNLSRGAQIINIVVTLITNKSIGFYTIYDNVTSTAYSTPVLEMTNQTFNISLVSPFTISNVQLIWNSTQYSATAQNPTNWYKIIQLPLISVNNTNVTIYWNYTVGAPAPYQNTSDSQTQVITFAYDFNTTSKDKSSYISGETMTLYSYILNHSTAATLNVYVTFNGSTYNSTYHNFTQNNLVYKTEITIPAVLNDNYTFNFSHNMTIQFNAQQRKTNITDSVLVRYLGVDNCTAYATPFLKLVTYDEETNAQLSTIDYDVLITWWIHSSIALKNYSISRSNFTDVTFCMSPPSANFTINMTVSYQDQYEEYSVRSWHYVNEPVSNTSKTQRLYLLNTSLSYYVSIEVSDGQGTEEPDILVKMQRFFYDEGIWRDVQIGKTDQAGKTAVYLIRYDEPYSFTLYAGQTFIRTYSGRTISESPLALSTAIITDTIWSHLLYVWSVCNFNNVTKLVSCAITDPSNRITGGRLIVDAEGLRGTGRICDTLFSGTSATVTCDISSSNTTSVFWKLSVIRDNIEWPINSGHIIINYPVVIWGTTGALFAFMIIILLGTIGAWNPAVGITLSVTGLVYCSLAGIFPISTSALIGVVVVAAILVFRMKT